MDIERRHSQSRAMVDSSYGRRIRGDAIVFNSLSKVLRDPRLGQFREIIRPEAVDRTLREAAEVKALWNHNSDTVLGNTRAGTLTLRKLRTALGIEIAPPSWAEPHMETIERGDVNGMSFAFRVFADGDEWDFRTENIPTRYVKDMVFSEVSIVTFQAYDETSVEISQRSVDAFIEERRIQLGSKSIEWLQRVHRQRLVS